MYVTADRSQFVPHALEFVFPYPDQFEDFFEEVYQELSKFGEISEMNVCDNLGDHLIGNVYVKVSFSASLSGQSLSARVVCVF